jgi:glycosyltransferase involved in cell wall biosynthesis
MTTAPLVSIIVPSYNQGIYIEQCIRSALDQDYRPIEIVVVDGGSRDETIEVLRSFDGVSELRWWSAPDDGPVSAVNKGLELARGSIGGIQSSDDYYLPGAIRSVVDAFLEQPTLGLVYGDAIKIDAGGRELMRQSVGRFSLVRLLSRATHVPQPAAFFSVILARELGGWDARIPYVSDADLWMRLAFRAPVRKLNAYLGVVRMHPEQRDRKIDLIQRDYARMLEQSQELRRASWRLRRAAAAGGRLLTLRYPVHRSNAELTRMLWHAVLLYPAVLRTPGLPRHRLIPGYFRLAGAAGRFRRWARGLVLRARIAGGGG